MKIRFKKLRLWLAYPVFIIFFFVARITDTSFVAGALGILLGMGIRFWASGYISKSRELATGGPYAFTRNPLYLGNFIIGLGFCSVSSNLWLIAYYVGSFTILYLGTIAEEETLLGDKFGAAYQDYKRNVARFFPGFKPYSSGTVKRFSLQQSFKNGEFIRLCGFTLVILFLELWRTFVLGQPQPGEIVLSSIFLFVVFLFLLWFNISIRRKSEAK